MHGGHGKRAGAGAWLIRCWDGDRARSTRRSGRRVRIAAPGESANGWSQGATSITMVMESCSLRTCGGFPGFTSSIVRARTLRGPRSRRRRSPAAELNDMVGPRVRRVSGAAARSWVSDMRDGWDYHGRDARRRSVRHPRQSAGPRGGAARGSRALASIEIVVGGDVLPGPDAVASRLARLLDLDLPVQFIQGNGDREVIAPTGAVPEPYRESMRWNADQLRARRTRSGWRAGRRRFAWVDRRRRRRPVLSRHAAERHGDFHAPDARRAAAADLRRPRRLGSRLRPHAHAVRSHDRSECVW